MSRTGVGSGAHRGHVCRFKQKEPCRTGARTRRRHVNNDWNARAENGADHRPGGIEQSAGGVQLNQQGLRSVGIGLCDGPVELACAHGLNGV